MSMDLVILAAGMGSRYGGLKQIDPVGPSGETVLDYAVFDARRAGFNRVVFVIRRDFEAVFRERVGAKYAGQMEVDYVFQSMDDLPVAPPAGAPPREKPWGTGHAVWCARAAVKTAFAVINADDFYGEDSFRRLGAFLSAGSNVAERGSVSSAEGTSRRSPYPPRYAMIGFRMSQTLSEFGAVSRGVCTVHPETHLLSTIEERTGIQRTDVGPGSGHTYSGDEVVSMNCWGFTPEIFPQLEASLRTFVLARGAEPKAEFYLPAAVAAMIAGSTAEVEVLPTNATWFGVTYRDDRPRVVAAIADLIAANRYPLSLVARVVPNALNVSPRTESNNALGLPAGALAKAGTTRATSS